MNKLAKISLLSLMLASFVSCTTNNESSINYQEKYGDNFKIENTTANKEYIYGMGDLAWSEYSWNPEGKKIDYKQTSKLMNTMGVKSVRVWLHCNWLMNDPNTYNEKGLALAKDIVSDLDSYGFQLIGMNHSNFHKSGYSNSSSTVAKPARDLSDGSYYLTWLDEYETTWYNIVKEFPTITYWEIDNESNIDTFFEKLGGGSFSLREKAAIYTDMLYFASKGIHRANKDAITVMGGLVIDTAEAFLEYIYDNIEADDAYSNYYDDYFQVAAWHPYMDTFTKEKFKRTNDDIYAVIKNREGKDKKVFLTEFGFSEGAVSVANQEKYIKDAYDVMKDELPYVESCHYFRMYDNLGSTWGSSKEKTFGLYTDPTDKGMINAEGKYQNEVKGNPKTTAYVYQNMAGGSGSLTFYADILNKVSENEN